MPGQGDQHRFRQLVHAHLPEHVDDLRRRVVSVGADMEQDIASAGSDMCIPSDQRTAERSPSSLACLQGSF
jgi:hypothetical protein